MIRADMLLSGHDDCIIRVSLKEREISRKRAVLILSPGMELSPEYIYVGTPGDCAAAISRCTAPVTFFSAGDCAELAETNCESVNLVVTSAGLIELHNYVTINYSKIIEWSDLISSSSNSDGSLRALIDQIREKTGVGFMIFNPSFYLMLYSLGKEAAKGLPARILASGYLVPSTVDRDFPASLKSPASRTLEVDGTSYLLMPILQNGNPLGYLLAVNFRSDYELEWVLGLLVQRVKTYLVAGYDTYTLRNNEFKHIFEDLMNSELRGLDIIAARLERLPNPPKKYMRLIIVRFLTHNKPIDEVIARLEPEFPNCSIASYRDQIVILVSDTYHLFAPKCNRGAVERILEEYSAIAVISHSGSRVLGLHTHYIQCKRMLDLIPSLNDNRSRRFFEFEEYELYYQIDLLADIIGGLYGHDDLMYLVHPAIVILTRYDRTKKTTLRDFLFVYIMSDCHIAATAKKLYLHRNTVIYRARRIKELTGLSLDNWELRVSLALSCMIMRYIEKKQQRSPRFDDYVPSDSCEGLSIPPDDSPASAETAKRR